MTEHRSPGIAYHRVSGFAADLFRCPPWRATLSVPACADRWHRAQKARGETAEELRPCLFCPIGAAHAGEKLIYRAANFMSPHCTRCRKGSGRRLIGALLCINCYNRQLEWLKGKNAKGTVPVVAASVLAVRTIGIVLDVGEPTERHVRFVGIAIDPEELKRAVSRVHEGGFEFCDPSDAYPAWRPTKLGDGPDLTKLPQARPVAKRAWRPPGSPVKLAAMASTFLSMKLERASFTRLLAPLSHRAHACRDDRVR